MDQEPDVIELGLANGGVIFVAGSAGDAEKALSDAARSGQSRLAWFTDARSGRAIGINPAQVVSLSAGESAN
jgi:hypothetical protein